MNENSQSNIEIDLFQLHYFLNDGSHSLNAEVLNSTESEFLKLCNEISKKIGIEIIIESYALEEGGIKSIYKLIVSNKKTYSLAVLGFFAIILQDTISEVASTLITEAFKSNEKENKEIQLLDEQIKESQKKQELIDLQSEETRLNIEEKKSKILNDTIASIKHIKDNIDDNQIELELESLNKEFLFNKYYDVYNSNKVVAYRSNFYRNISKEEKISKISTQILNLNGEPISEEKLVVRSDFKNFIKNEEMLSPKILEQIEIEVVAPVLKNNKLSWRALYLGNSISFNLKDSDFKKLILNQKISFQNGTKLLCDLEIRQKIDINGNIKELGKSVINVYKVTYTDGLEILI